MRLIIELDTDNAAFDGYEGAASAETARILHNLAERIAEGGILEGMILRDYNGNSVGTTRVEV